MANKRMFSKNVLQTDAFLDLPLSAQALYIHLSMEADDDGVVASPRRITRMIGGAVSDLEALINARFLLSFESVNVVVIKHWRVNNTIKTDRYTVSNYSEVLGQLYVKPNGAYTETECEGAVPVTERIQNGAKKEQAKDKTEPKSDKAEPKRNQNGTKKETLEEMGRRLGIEANLSGPCMMKLNDWLKYKSERREAYKETGLKSLVSQIAKACEEYGDGAMVELINECMANGWKGIIFDKLKNGYGTRNTVSNNNYSAGLAWAGGAE